MSTSSRRASCRRPRPRSRAACSPTRRSGRPGRSARCRRTAPARRRRGRRRRERDRAPAASAAAERGQQEVDDQADDAEAAAAEGDPATDAATTAGPAQVVDRRRVEVGVLVEPHLCLPRPSRTLGGIPPHRYPPRSHGSRSASASAGSRVGPRPRPAASPRGGPRAARLPRGSVAERPNALALKARARKRVGGSNPSASAALTSGSGGDRGVRCAGGWPGCSNGVAVAGQAAPQSILSTASRMLSRLVCA